MQLDLRDKVFIEYNVRQVYSIPAEYQGRVGALRCKRGDVDFWFLVVYSQGRTEAERLRVSGLWRYVVSLVSALPHRCVQVLFTDCNGKNGLHRDADGVCLPIEAPVIGGCTAELENSNGNIFRECLEEQFLCSVHSHLAPGHTYFGNIAGVRSRIDHVCLQHAMLHTVVSSAVLSSLGAQLQRIRGPGKRDRIPVSMFFRHHCSFRGSTLKVATVHGICLHWQMVFCGVMGVIVLSQLLNGIVLAWPARL